MYILVSNIDIVKSFELKKKDLVESQKVFGLNNSCYNM